ncbi:hypothetical protein BY458DRAFT_528781 [Sporodiniella umbellata]|nr:hypothetical protein BY458DRAFT_528781 [Sporodiniella umbellata]
MIPEDVALQLKKNGTFDNLRKELYFNFHQKDREGEFINKLKLFIEELIVKDPSLLNSPSFFDHVNKKIEESSIYPSLKEQALDTLQEDEYKNKIIDQVETIQKEE